MALPKLDKDIAYISKLDDEPNDVGGLSADELKARFDQAGQDIQAYVNQNLLPYLEGVEAAASLGIRTISGMTSAKNIQEALEALKHAIDNTATGSIPDASLSGAKLVEGAIGNRELAAKAIEGKNIADSTIEGKNIADSTIEGKNIADSTIRSQHIAYDTLETRHLVDGAVDAGKLSNGAVTAAKLAAGSVQEPAIADDAVTTAKVQDKAVTAAKLADDAKSKGVSVTLTTGGWSSKKQTVSVDGVTADNNVIVASDPASRTAWNDAEVYCSAQGEGTLTFACSSVPSSDVTANVVILV